MLCVGVGDPLWLADTDVDVQPLGLALIDGLVLLDIEDDALEQPLEVSEDEALGDKEPDTLTEDVTHELDV